MDHPASRSPSPPPSLPISSHPGPRASALQKIFSSALTTTVKTNSYANFSSCFPTPARYCPTALEGVWKQINLRFVQNCQNEFGAILRERNVVEGLNTWDGVVDEARRRCNVSVDGESVGRAPHEMSGQELYEAYRSPYLEQAATVLRERLQQVQMHNAEMGERLTAQREEMDGLMAGLEGAVRDIKGSGNAMRENSDGNGVEGLREEVWQMEQEVQATR